MDARSEPFQSPHITNASSSLSGEEPIPLWVSILEEVQDGLVILGALLNACMFLMLFWTTSVSPLMKVLLKHQALLDFLVCLIGAIILVQPFMWTVGVWKVDVVICHIWHSQMIYWWAFTIAGWNLVLIAIERFLAVCKPFYYANISTSRMKLLFIPVYIGTLLCTVPGVFKHRFVNGTCETKDFFQGPEAKQFFLFFSISWAFLNYFLPCLLFFIFYGKIILTLRKRRAEFHLGQSRIINQATHQLTKTAVIITVVYIMTIGPDSWLYVLAGFGVAEYNEGSHLQKVMVFFTLLNSCSNPVIFLCVLPSYRHDVVKLLKCPSKKEINSVNSNSTQTVATVATVATVVESI